MPADYASQYTPVLLAGAFGFVIVAALLFLNRLLAPRRSEQNKGLTYECGMLPIGRGWEQYHVRYYLYAILFLIFEVEAVFIFPWAIVLDALGEIAFLEMLVFLGILAFGLAYAWRKGVLEWEK
jgi:NADH-quinone oxidoreductase subunit A